MNLCAEERLAYLEIVCHCGRSHPYVHAEAGYIALPDAFIPEIELRKLSRETEVAAYGLSYTFPVKRPRYRINNGVCYRAVKLVSQVIRRDEIKTLLEHRAQEKINPLWSYTSEVGVHYNAGLNVELPGYLEDCSECAAFTGDSVIRCINLHHRAYPVWYEERFKILDHGVLESADCFVRGASV